MRLRNGNESVSNQILQVLGNTPLLHMSDTFKCVVPITMATSGQRGDNAVRLLDFWGSMFGLRTRIALEEKGIEYEYIEQDFSKSLSKSELLVQMNPIYQKVPVLIHNDKPIVESLIIIEYIDEVWKGNFPSLLPADPCQKALARSWARYIDEQVYVNGDIIWRKGGEEREIGKRAFIESLKTLEEELGEKTYFGGESFGFVDIALVPFYPWFYVYEKFGNFSVEAECPKLMAWAKRCMERESVCRNFPDGRRVYDFVLYLRKMFGIET